jgi:hypothetical protein
MLAYRPIEIVMVVLSSVMRTGYFVLIQFGDASCGSDLLCMRTHSNCVVVQFGARRVTFLLSLINCIRNPDLQDALVAIKGGRIPPPGSLPSFEEIKDTLGFNHYYEEEKRYVATPAQSSYGSGECILSYKLCWIWAGFSYPGTSQI